MIEQEQVTTVTNADYQDYVKSLVEMNENILERERNNRARFLGALTGYATFDWGPPGTGKTFGSEYFQRVFIGGIRFQRTCHPTQPSEELMGPPDLSKLEQGKFERNIENTALTAEFVYFDELFNGNPPALMAFQTCLSSKEFHQNGSVHKLPLLFFDATGNHIPQDETLEQLGAWWDRMLFRLYAGDLEEIDNMITVGENFLVDEKPTPTNTIPLDSLLDAREQVKEIEVRKIIITKLAEIIKKGRLEGVTNSTRRFNQSLRICQANAWLEGRDSVLSSDFDVLKDVLWEDPDQKDIISGIIDSYITPEYRDAKNLLSSIQLDYFNAKKGEKTASEIWDVETQGKSQMKAITLRAKELPKEEAMGVVSILKEIKIHLDKINDLAAKTL